MSEFKKKDTGLRGIKVTDSSICSISDGLKYRGYSIEDLAQFAYYWLKLSHILQFILNIYFKDTFLLPIQPQNTYYPYGQRGSKWVHWRKR